MTTENNSKKTSSKNNFPKLPTLVKSLKRLKEIILANTVIIGQIHSPTFGEEKRARFLLDRFLESGLADLYKDDYGNAIAHVPGKKGKNKIVINAHLDINFAKEVDCNFFVNADNITGPGVCDNTLGAAILATLPLILKELNISFNSDLILVGDVRSIGRGNLGGIREFVKESKDTNIKAAICVEGVQLGRLNHMSVAMQRGEISINLEDSEDDIETGLSGQNAIILINEIMNEILSIALPRMPKSSIVFGKINGGFRHGIKASKAMLGFEIQSRSSEMLEKIKENVEYICSKISSESEQNISLDFFADREAVEIKFDHPLVKSALEVQKELKIKSRPFPSMSEVSAFLEAGIPAVNIGITKGSHLNTMEEYALIEPIFTGIAQLLGIINKIDKDL